MIGKRHEFARLHLDFYRDKFRKTLRWIMVAIVIIFLLLAAIIYTIIFRPTTQYYANTTDGRILAMPPANQG